MRVRWWDGHWSRAAARRFRVAFARSFLVLLFLAFFFLFSLFLLQPCAFDRGLDDGFLARLFRFFFFGQRFFVLYRLQFRGSLGGEAGVVFVLLAFQSQCAEIVARARGIGLLLRPCLPAGLARRDFDHRDAVDRAGRHAQVAAGAQ